MQRFLVVAATVFILITVECRDLEHRHRGTEISRREAEAANQEKKGSESVEMILGNN